jgi:hypothetical protein
VKSRTSFAIAMVLTAVGWVALAANTGSTKLNVLRAKAQAELTRVTMDFDKANIMYSPVDNSLGASFMKVEQYQQECLAGRETFYEGKHVEALQHLRKADEIIRAQPDWIEAQELSVLQINAHCANEVSHDHYARDRQRDRAV